MLKNHQQQKLDTLRAAIKEAGDEIDRAEFYTDSQIEFELEKMMQEVDQETDR